jgi:hypothetical protein
MTDAPDPSTVQALLDIEEIKQLKARYFRLMDTKAWDEWGEVFATDALMEVPEAQLVINGRAEIVAMVSGALAEARSAHHGHMPEIELTGPDTARGIWAMFDFVEWPAPDGAAVGAGLHGYGHYHEEYVREEGRWRIATLRLDRLRIDPLG